MSENPWARALRLIAEKPVLDGSAAMDLRNAAGYIEEATAMVAELQAEIEELEAEHVSYANLESTDSGVRVCWGNHSKAEGCRWEYYPPEQETP